MVMVFKPLLRLHAEAIVARDNDNGRGEVRDSVNAVVEISEYFVRALLSNKSTLCLDYGMESIRQRDSYRIRACFKARNELNQQGELISVI
ncbi:hypothetical protein BTUL_0144g00090 [Botrytis tulipae]|uniref:Uncharacterized protein n=1 Tax=Botrytis tulipae TaxID=87230 RepID=A0A4Z1ECW5_9HELO|nr:hypothetical protein BTUL_0144g00090 [Botrytis tulipae]